MQSASYAPLERSAVSTGGVTAWCIENKASRGDVIAFKALVRAECIHQTSMETLRNSTAVIQKSFKYPFVICIRKSFYHMKVEAY